MKEITSFGQQTHEYISKFREFCFDYDPYIESRMNELQIIDQIEGLLRNLMHQENETKNKFIEDVEGLCFDYRVNVILDFGSRMKDILNHVDDSHDDVPY